MPSLNPDHIRAVLNAINKSSYFKHLSMIVTEMGTGRSVVELTVGHEHLNPFGGLHGGAYASVIDTAAYWATYCEIEEKAGLISIDLNLDFLAPIREGTITARGRSIKIGKTMCLAEAVATDKDGRWLAHGTSKMLVMQGLQTIEDAFQFTGAPGFCPKFTKKNTS